MYREASCGRGYSRIEDTIRIFSFFCSRLLRGPLRLRGWRACGPGWWEAVRWRIPTQLIRPPRCTASGPGWPSTAGSARRWLNWALGSAVLLLGLGENLFGLLARGDWESQFVAMHSDDMLFTEPWFFHLFSPANFTADLVIHVAVIPVVLFALIMAHLTLVRLQGIARPL